MKYKNNQKIPSRINNNSIETYILQKTKKSLVTHKDIKNVSNDQI